MAFPDDYKYQKDITTDATQVDSNETGFPYYLDLSTITDSLLWNNVQTDGGDLRVSTDSAGTSQVPLEVVSIDTTGETGEIHFKDSTDSASNKTYYLWWDDSTGTVSQPAVTDTFGRNNVWTTYEAVLHLNETSGSTATDSTGNGNDGTYNGNLPTSTSLTVGDGQDFDGTGDYIDLPTFSTISSSQSFSVSIWASPDNFGDPGDVVFSHSLSGTDRWAFSFKNNDLGGAFYNGTVFDFAVSTTTSLSTGTEYKFDITFDGSSTHKLYLDGSQETGTNNYHASGTGTDFNLGAQSVSNGNELDGRLNEFRVASSVLSAGWFGTEYNMQSSNGTFWTLGNTTEFDKTATFSIDAQIQQTDISTTFTTDANIQATDQTQTFDIDANVQQQDITRTFDIDAVLAKQFSNTFSIDAILQNTDQPATFSMDALVQATDQSATFSIDAVLAKQLSKTFDIDTLISETDQTLAFTIDTLLQTTDQSTTFSIDATLQIEQSQTFDIDAVLAKQLSKTFSIDAKLSIIDVEETFTIDAQVVKQTTATALQDFDRILTEVGRDVTLITSTKTRDDAGDVTSATRTTETVRAVFQPLTQEERQKLDVGLVKQGAMKVFTKGIEINPGDIIKDPIEQQEWRVEEKEGGFTRDGYEIYRKSIVQRTD